MMAQNPPAFLAAIHITAVHLSNRKPWPWDSIWWTLETWAWDTKNTMEDLVECHCTDSSWIQQCVFLLLLFLLESSRQMFETCSVELLIFRSERTQWRVIATFGDCWHFSWTRNISVASHYVTFLHHILPLPSNAFHLRLFTGTARQGSSWVHVLQHLLLFNANLMHGERIWLLKHHQHQVKVLTMTKRQLSHQAYSLSRSVFTQHVIFWNCQANVVLHKEDVHYVLRSRCMYLLQQIYMKSVCTPDKQKCKNVSLYTYLYKPTTYILLLWQQISIANNWHLPSPLRHLVANLTHGILKAGWRTNIHLGWGKKMVLLTSPNHENLEKNTHHFWTTSVLVKWCPLPKRTKKKQQERHLPT